MKKEFSIYLDLVRFIAATLVVVYHSNIRVLVSDILPLSSYGHSAVVVFFVLSGYVIAYVTERKESTPTSYWVARSARIYSVAIAALLLALVIDPIGESLNPALYQGRMAHDYWYVRLASSLLFLNEIWFVSIMAFSNVPYWSLNYEVWYYILFAAAVFLQGRKRWFALAGIALVVGPKILLLAPVWWLGVYLHRSRYFANISELSGWLMFVASLVLLWQFQALRVEYVLSQFLRDQVGEHWFRQLTFSRFFLSDYILGALVFLNFAGFRAIGHRFSWLCTRNETWIRWLASYTFSIYLFHQPLILFFTALIDGDPDGYWFYAKVMASVTVSILLLGRVSEHRKADFRKLSILVIETLVRLWAKLGGERVRDIAESARPSLVRNPKD